MKTAELTRLSIETSNLCNLKCIMCLHHGPFYRGQADAHPKYMEMSFFKEIINQYKNLNPLPKHVTPHFQGEPLCYPKFFEAVEYIEEKGITWNITTNGMLMDREMSEFLAVCKNLVGVCFSVDGLTPEVNEKIRIGVDHRKLLYNMEYFLSLFKNRPEVRVGVNFVRMEENNCEYMDFVRYWIDRVHVNSSICTDLEGIPVKKYWVPEKRLPCLAPSYFAVILTNRDVIPCCRDHQYEMIMGNLCSQSLKEVWEGERYNVLRDQQEYREWFENKLCLICDTWMCEYMETMYRIRVMDKNIIVKQGPFWEEFTRIGGT